MNVIVAAILALMCALPATLWSSVNDQMFQKMFGVFGISFLASLIACYVAQAFDIRLYLLIRHITKERYLWLRSNGSTCISLLIDTCAVIGIMTIFGVIPSAQMWNLVFDSYIWKVIFTLSTTPLFYLSVNVIRRLRT